MAFNPTAVGALAGTGGMVKALMDGQGQYDDQQKKTQQMQQMMAMRGGGAPAQPPGPPMNIQPPAQMGQPPMVPGGVGMPVPPRQMQGGMPFPMTGAPPVNIDPMTKALFSPIPGMNPQGG